MPRNAMEPATKYIHPMKREALYGNFGERDIEDYPDEVRGMAEQLAKMTARQAQNYQGEMNRRGMEMSMPEKRGLATAYYRENPRHALDSSEDWKYTPGMGSLSIGAKDEELDAILQALENMQTGRGRGR